MVAEPLPVCTHGFSFLLGFAGSGKYSTLLIRTRPLCQARHHRAGRQADFSTCILVTVGVILENEGPGEAR